jgi:cytochrome c oxidase subunit 4
MANSPEEVAKHVKTYLKVGMTLLFLTAVTVWLSYVDFGTHSRNMAIGLIVATFKTSLVVLIFMHMNHERPLIYKFMLFSMLLLGVMFTLFVFVHDDGLIMRGYQSVFGKH